MVVKPGSVDLWGLLLLVGGGVVTIYCDIVVVVVGVVVAWRIAGGPLSLCWTAWWLSYRLRRVHVIPRSLARGVTTGVRLLLLLLL